MPLLENAHLVLLVAHFVGLAALIGPYLSQVRRQESLHLRLMLTGSIVQVVTGNALIAANRLQGLHVIELKMIVKLSIAVVALGLLVAAILVQRRRGREAGAVRRLFHTAGGLAIVDVVVAVMWR